MGDLVQVLEHAAIPASPAQGVLVANDHSDDAAIVSLGNDVAPQLVFTADVIAPLVDDAEAFGEIAATNSVSDVYAMGGRPLYALNLAFFPSDQLPLEILSAILRGGARACQRMGVAIVGGHTVRDTDIKYGLAVTGLVAPEHVLSNRGARPDQALVLTKRLGTGVIGTAIKKQRASDNHIDAAIATMTRHNGTAVEIAREFGVTACTDVTGFGLLGHLRNICRGSGVGARVELSNLQLLPGTLDYAAQGLVPGGSKANQSFVQPEITRVGEVDPLLELIACDAQTSGGLLLCCPSQQAAKLVDALATQEIPAAQIGVLTTGTGIELRA